MTFRLARLAARLMLVCVILGIVAIGGGALWAYSHYGRGLPDYQQLATYMPPTGSRVYAGDSSLMAEYATERRIITPIANIPPRLIQAFLAAEDRDFYNHKGVNPLSILRAAATNILRYGRGYRPIGASTITQQIVKHFLLNSEVSFSRKIKEAILAYRIEGGLSKDRILEIYLNEIYLGAGAYGVAAAAETYFQKPLDRLSLAEAAYLAALPKAPSRYNPLRFPQAAKARRDWVLAGMAETGFATSADVRAAQAEPISARPRTDPLTPPPGYFAEEVRRELIARFGEKRVYEGGLTVRSSYVPIYQEMAERSFRAGLVDYDRRHGWRGPIARLPNPALGESGLSQIADPPGIGGWQMAAVLGIDAGGAQIALKNGGRGRIPTEELRWARRALEDQRLGPAIRNAIEVLAPGDVVLVEPAAAAPGPRAQSTFGTYALRQIPEVSGGFVAMDPKTGRVFALVGGWDHQASQFNRATQAKRQPGSAIKPFVYLAALEHGFTPSTTVLDGPIELDQGPGMPKWRPVNYEAGSFAGQSTLRQGIEHSRNLETARLASMIGMKTVGNTVESFGIMDKMPLLWSMALGAGETTVLRLTSAYAMIDNGGRRLLPSMIDSVQDRDGRVLYQKGVAFCVACYVEAGPRTSPETSALYRPAAAATASPEIRLAANAIIYKPIKPDGLVDPISAYQILSMMQGVVERGTGTVVKAVGKPLAGKTGTSSDFYDAWFVGFSPDIAAGVYVGFDTPRTLGDGETGGHVAAPIFRDFMAEALRNAPPTPFTPPFGASIVTVNAISGLPTSAGDRNAVQEAFKPGTEPKAPAPSLPDDMIGDASADGRLPIQPASGTGGLY